MNRKILTVRKKRKFRWVCGKYWKCFRFCCFYSLNSIELLWICNTVFLIISCYAFHMRFLCLDYVRMPYESYGGCIFLCIDLATCSLGHHSKNHTMKSILDWTIPISIVQNNFLNLVQLHSFFRLFSLQQSSWLYILFLYLLKNCFSY